MYKKISTLLFALFVTSQIANAQIQIGGGFIYGTEIEELGLQVNGTLNVPGPIRLAADIGIFLVDDVGNTEAGFWELNFNGHYMLPGIPKANVYGLAGLNLSTATLKNDTFNIDTSNSELGLNIGGGAEIPLGFAKLFGELRVVVGEADQAVLSGGLRFGIGK